jgi:hypothetical protein
MRSYLKVVASLVFFTTAFTLIGIEAGRNQLHGGIIGGLVGTLFGLIFGGGFPRGNLLAALYPSGDDERDTDHETA